MHTQENLYTSLNIEDPTIIEFCPMLINLVYEMNTAAV